jgi:hypothetical protein
MAPAAQQPFPGECVQENVMAKGQKRSNREVRKPKKVREIPAPATIPPKGLANATGASRKKP